MNDQPKTEVTQAAAEAVPSRSFASCVKFNPDEYKLISEDADLSERSIPTLLKLAYFSQKRVSILMKPSDQERWFKELRHWGNNLNQIAKRMNSGLMSGWYEELRLARAALTRIEHKILGIHGHT